MGPDPINPDPINLDFETAALLRDEINILERKLENK